MKIAIAQVNTTTGDVEGNLRKVKENVARAAAACADLAVFPELTLSGWMPMDLLRERQFVARNEQALAEAAEAARGVAALVGHVGRDEQGRFVSAASLLADGKRIATFCGVPLEWRDPWRELGCEAYSCAVETAEAGVGKVAVASGGVPLSCVPPERVRDADVVVSVSARPFRRGCTAERESSHCRAAQRLCVPAVLANLVGGNGSVVFDGCSLVVDPSGRRVAAAAFREDLLMAELDADGLRQPQGGSEVREAGETWQVYEALKLGLADYVRKCGFSDVVLGLSGGIDSAVLATIAADVLGPEHVTALGMPSVYSSEITREAARVVAQRLGINYHVVSIEGLRVAFEEALAPLFAGMAPDVAEQNIQARIRGTLLMTYANKFGAMPLASGNRSELAVGYCTLYGDTAGGLAPIGDVPKSVVYELAAYIDLKRDVIPRYVMELPPSAELKPGQKDQDDLPPYEVLDRILELYLDEGLDAAAIIEEGFDARIVEEVVARVKWSEFKRRQAPPPLHVFSRRPWPSMPLGARWREPHI